MTTTTRTGTRSPARPAADSHDLVRVQGARVNNLKDISIELPKRRLSVFTGVSGSGKSSLVFGTIAAESQRMINETYSTFVQTFMPTLARPDVDVLEGLTTAIIVDQERMGANARSTVGTATDANAMLRILFSRLGQPHIGSPNAFSFNVPSVSGEGAITVDRGTAGRRPRSELQRPGGMCPRCEGMGSVNDFDLTALYDESKSLNEGALTDPTYSMDGWYGRSSRLRLLRHGQAHPRLLEAGAARPALAGGDQGQGRGHQPHLRGRDPQDAEVVLSKDVDTLQPHIRAFVERAVTFTTCPECGGTRLGAPARSSKIAASHRGRLRDADQRPCRLDREPGRALRRVPCSPRSGGRSTRSSGSDWATSASTGRRARCRAARRSAPR